MHFEFIGTGRSALSSGPLRTRQILLPEFFDSVLKE